MATRPPTRHRRGVRLAFLTGIVTSLLGSLLAAPSATTGPTLAPSARADPPVPRLRWSSCGEGLECTTAQVPLDHDRPSGAIISLALIRLPASGPDRRIGSIFVNPGGPGRSGVDTIRQGGRSLFSAAVRARFDLVGFDPRGIGASTPLRCFATLDQALAVLPPSPFPVTAAEERAWQAAGGPVQRSIRLAWRI
jgi:hypothetical protein